MRSAPESQRPRLRPRLISVISILITSRRARMYHHGVGSYSRQALCLVVTISAFVTPACGQAFNIDCAGNLATPPAASYGAGAGQPGFWNPASITADLRDLDGAPTAARLGADAGTNAYDIPGAIGDDERLMETVFEVLQSSNGIVLSNLSAGQYDLYAYSWGGQIFGARTVGFTVLNGVNTYGGALSFGPQWPSGQVEGETFARIPVEVLPGLNFLRLRLGGGGPKTFNVLAGIQLVPVPAPAAPIALLIPTAAIALRRRR